MLCIILLISEGGNTMFFTFAYKPYIVIIGDIIDSRKIEKRGEVQERLKQILQGILVRKRKIKVQLQKRQERLLMQLKNILLQLFRIWIQFLKPTFIKLEKLVQTKVLWLKLTIVTASGQKNKLMTLLQVVVCL